MSKPVIVIVPGSWHRPQHYRHLLDGLSKVNYEAIGVTIPSVDSSPPHTSWDQDAAAVRRVILDNLDAGKDVIVVGHSFGGVTMSEAVKGLNKKEREEQGLKGAVVSLVYMCGMALPVGLSHNGQMKPQTPEEEELEQQRQELQTRYGGINITEVNKDGAMVLGKDIIGDVFYNGCDPKDVKEAIDLLGSHPVAPLGVPATYAAYLDIPSTYILCENDRALPPVVQERISSQGNGAFHVVRCKEGHSPFMSNPGFIVDCVRRAAGETAV